MLGQIKYGRLENLQIRNGEPVLDDTHPRIVCTVRFAAREAADPIPSTEELAAQPAVQDLMRFMDRMRDGTIVRIEVRQSSPVYAEIQITGTTAGGPHA
jgi:hypothetical protein